MKEIREILGDLDAEILSLREAGIDVEVDENGSTFEENAIIKAKAICQKAGCLVLADDSGLEIGDRISDSDGLAELESVRDRIAISQAIGRLPPLWRQIVMFRYFRNMTQQRTAEELGLTQVKVSREEKKIAEFLRRELCGQFWCFLYLQP